jgi:hypothetical protein
MLKPTLPFPRRTPRRINTPRLPRALIGSNGSKRSLSRISPKPKTTPAVDVLQRLVLEKPDELNYLANLALEILGATQRRSGQRTTAPPMRGTGPLAAVFSRLAWENPKGLRKVEQLARLALDELDMPITLPATP